MSNWINLPWTIELGWDIICHQFTNIILTSVPKKLQSLSSHESLEHHSLGEGNRIKTVSSFSCLQLFSPHFPADYWTGPHSSTPPVLDGTTHCHTLLSHPSLSLSPSVSPSIPQKARIQSFSHTLSCSFHFSPPLPPLLLWPISGATATETNVSSTDGDTHSLSLPLSLTHTHSNISEFEERLKKRGNDSLCLRLHYKTCAAVCVSVFMSASFILSLWVHRSNFSSSIWQIKYSCGERTHEIRAGLKIDKTVLLCTVRVRRY